MQKTIIASLAIAFVLAGCKKVEGDKAAGRAAAKPGDGDSMFGGFDASAEVKALQGTWKVRDSAFAKEPSTWTIEGDKLTIKTGDKTREGRIEIQHPGELAFVEKSEGSGTSRSYFAYARNGSDVYIGLGTAGIKLGDSYMVGDDGVVVMKANACKYFRKKMFGGFDEPADVKCDVKDEGGKKVFSYQVPDRFKKGEMQVKSVDLVGDALLNQQMTGHKVEKAHADFDCKHEHAHAGHEAALPAPGPLDEKLGRALSGAELVAVEDLQKDPAAWEGKMIRLEGRVTDMCFHRRGWFGVASADGAKVIRVITGQAGFLVPAGAVGSRARAEGTLKVVTLDHEQIAHYKKIHKFISDEELRSGGPIRQPLLIAFGAEFLRQ